MHTTVLNTKAKYESGMFCLFPITNKPKAVAYEAFGKFHKIKHVKQDEMLIMVFLGGTTFDWRS